MGKEKRALRYHLFVTTPLRSHKINNEKCHSSLTTKPIGQKRKKKEEIPNKPHDTEWKEAIYAKEKANKEAFTNTHAEYFQPDLTEYLRQVAG